MKVFISSLIVGMEPIRKAARDDQPVMAEDFGARPHCAGTEEGDVVAVVAQDEVVAVTAEDRVGALAAEDDVVTSAAVERQLYDADRQGRGGDAVVAAVALDDERVVRPFR